MNQDENDLNRRDVLKRTVSSKAASIPQAASR
jgi:hypothetical protein